MRRALIGHTGFVGSILRAEGGFTHFYNSRNVADLRGAEFDEIWCAGVQAVKWWANQNEAADWAGISSLLDVLGAVTADKFVLISTVDVYPQPVEVDEDSAIDEAALQPYGRHRLQVERFVADRFPVHHILRLPGLFGAGLKKNLIFDALEGKPLDGFDARSTFQFYDLGRLHGDALLACGAGFETLNMAVEPVSVGAVLHAITGEVYAHHRPEAPARYDMHTRHAAAWGRTGPYLQSSDEVLQGVARFAKAWRATAVQGEGRA